MERVDMDQGRAAENETLDALMDRIRGQEETDDAVISSLPDIVAGDSGGSSSADVAGALGAIRPELLRSVKLRVRVELGRTRLPLGTALALGSGSVVELGRQVGDPVDVLVNDVPIAQGQIVVVDDRFCVRITRILPGAAAIEKASGVVSS
jgi:flagellar motor switch protein FliN